MLQYKSPELCIYESALYRTTSTLFQNEDLILLVDPTWLPQEVAQLQKVVAALADDRPLYLLFTHSDYDHIIAWQAFPQAQTIVSRAFVDNPSAQKTVAQILDFDQQYYLQRDYPIAYPKGDYIVEQDGQVLTIGQTQLTFYLAPGHNPDGIFTIVEPYGLWIAGDYLSNIEFPFIYHSSTAYEATLGKVDLILKRHTINYLIPGHGDHTKNREEIKSRKIEGIRYIQQLRTAIKEGASFDEDLLRQRYQFARGMKGFHEGNIQLIKEELGGK